MTRCSLPYHSAIGETEFIKRETILTREEGQFPIGPNLVSPQSFSRNMAPIIPPPTIDFRIYNQQETIQIYLLTVTPRVKALWRSRLALARHFSEITRRERCACIRPAKYLPDGALIRNARRYGLDSR